MSIISAQRTDSNVTQANSNLSYGNLSMNQYGKLLVDETNSSSIKSTTDEFYYYFNNYHNWVSIYNSDDERVASFSAADYANAFTNRLQFKAGSVNHGQDKGMRIIQINTLGDVVYSTRFICSIFYPVNRYDFDLNWNSS